jgi:hypothetical protein
LGAFSSASQALDLGSPSQSAVFGAQVGLHCPPLQVTAVVFVLLHGAQSKFVALHP